MLLNVMKRMPRKSMMALGAAGLLFPNGAAMAGQEGGLVVNITPPEAKDSVKWSADEGLTWHSSNEPVALPAGEHHLTYAPVVGMEVPMGGNVSISGDKITYLTAAVSDLSETTAGQAASGSITFTVVPLSSTVQMGGTLIFTETITNNGSETVNTTLYNRLVRPDMSTSPITQFSSTRIDAGGNMSITRVIKIGNDTTAGKWTLQAAVGVNGKYTSKTFDFIVAPGSGGAPF